MSVDKSYTPYNQRFAHLATMVSLDSEQRSPAVYSYGRCPEHYPHHLGLRQHRSKLLPLLLEKSPQSKLIWPTTDAAKLKSSIGPYTS